MSEWTLLDHTNGKNGGYYRIERDGCLIADLFPFAVAAIAEWIKSQAELIVRVMNEQELPTVAQTLGERPFQRD